jgi:hypothetical protein
MHGDSMEAPIHDCYWQMLRIAPHMEFMVVVVGSKMVV